MQALGGMIAGNPAQGYQQSRLRGQQIQGGDIDLSTGAAIQNAAPQLAPLFNTFGAPPQTTWPGQASQPPQMAAGASPQQPPMGSSPPPPQTPPGGPQSAFAPGPNFQLGPRQPPTPGNGLPPQMASRWPASGEQMQQRTLQPGAPVVAQDQPPMPAMDPLQQRPGQPQQPPMGAVTPGQAGQGTGFPNPMQIYSTIARANPGTSPEVIARATERVMTMFQPTAMMRMYEQEQNRRSREDIASLNRQSREKMAGYGAEGGPGNQAAEVGQAIIDGRQPPVLTGMYRQQMPVRAYLAENNFDLAKAQREWQMATRQVSSLNAPQMQRFVGVANSVDATIDEVRNLSQQLDQSGIQLLNRAQLTAYIQTAGNSPTGQLATRYVTALNTLREEFANMATGGYAPTESVWKLANRQLNENFGRQQMDASLTEIQRLIRYRLNAIPGLQQSGPGAPNRYTPGTERPIPPAPERPAQGAPAEGSKIIRYDAQGNRVE